MAIGKPGARNAAWFAAAILGLGDPSVAGALEAGRRRLSDAVLGDDEEVRRTA
jgi:phosphoribosylcarboxyaminoimidazole (NCAIR) mutase